MVSIIQYHSEGQSSNFDFIKIIVNKFSPQQGMSSSPDIILTCNKMLHQPLGGGLVKTVGTSICWENTKTQNLQIGISARHLQSTNYICKYVCLYLASLGQKI